jgi:hypothetical protein
VLPLHHHGLARSPDEWDDGDGMTRPTVLCAVRVRGVTIVRLVLFRAVVAWQPYVYESARGCGVRMGRDRIISTGFIAAAGALLVAAPAVLTAAGVRDWRWLTAAAVVAAVGALFAGIWQTRLDRSVQRRDSRAEELTMGTFTPRGKLPLVREVTDPIGMIRVHPATHRDETGSAGDRGAGVCAA